MVCKLPLTVEPLAEFATSLIVLNLQRTFIKNSQFSHGCFTLIGKIPPYFIEKGFIPTFIILPVQQSRSLMTDLNPRRNALPDTAIPC